MDRLSAQSSEVLLARLNHEIENISVSQHRLARRKAILQKQITLLRLGASPTEVRLALKAVSVVAQEERRRWTDWESSPARDERRRYAGGLR
jgi:hypothetical protein